MLLRKYMSLLGIGSAKIDLILEKESYRPGEPVHGYFFIQGGTIEQQVKRIECDLVMLDQISGVETIVDSATILSGAKIESEEMNKINFSFQLPESVALTDENTSYCFHTKLHFNEGVLSRDEDVIKIIH
ncbi:MULTISPECIES: sporulation protein [unclassified Bacillus (in: firmicutes)]|uniref:sporulation protein n=1 Tax=unclassified Bacillus (in: firmicutes) TaxID=185979 RepID=UPI000B81BDEB|nr:MULTISPECIES: sporulation protein [unclassified Bacillus (in: firmicutes)]